MKIIYIIISLMFMAGCAVDYDKIQEKRLQKYLSNNPHADRLMVAKISRGMISDGMGREEVLASWGRPAEALKNGRYEKWTFGETRKGYIKVSGIVFFKDGKVIDWVK